MSDLLVYLYYQFITVHVIDNYTSHYRRLFDISCSVRIESMAIVLYSTVCKSTVFSKLRKKYFYVLSIFQASLFLLPLLSVHLGLAVARQSTPVVVVLAVVPKVQYR